MDTVFRVAVVNGGYCVSERRVSDGNTRFVTDPDPDIRESVFMARQLNRISPENRDRWLTAHGYPPFVGLARPRPASPLILDIIV